jgi:hypothetical protein
MKPCAGCKKPVVFDTNIIKKRYQTCKICEHRKVVHIPIVNKKLEYCNACGCPLVTRLRTDCKLEKF